MSGAAGRGRKASRRGLRRVTLAITARSLRALLFNPVLLALWERALRGRLEFFGSSHTLGDMVIMDYYLKRRLAYGSRVHAVFLANKPHMANAYLGRLLARAFGAPRTHIIMSRWLCRVLEPLERRLFFAGPQAKLTQHPADYHDLNARCTFHVEQWVAAAERTRAREAMEALGLPRDARFVCVHAREAGFKAAVQPDGHNTYRDVDIATYGPALEHLIEEGYWIVRMGEPTVAPLPAMPRAIDYARSPLKSDWLDVVLVAECEFLLGCNSGFSQLAHLFNKRALWTNSIPVEMCPWDDLALWIPKLIFSRREGRLLSFPEIVSRGIGQYHRTEQYAAEALEPQANAPEDILEATRELCRWIRGEAPTAEDRQAQEAFTRLFPPHYNAHGTGARICASFLRAHAELMPGPAPAVHAIGGP